MHNQNILTSTAGCVLGVLLLSAGTGCVGYVREPHRAYVQPAPVYVEAPVVVQPDYVYYPDYQVYYSGHTHQYVYQDGRTWVTRPAPPRVSAEILLGSPSVRLDFRDHPSAHHSAIVQQYPRHWSPPGPGRRDDRR